MPVRREDFSPCCSRWQAAETAKRNARDNQNSGTRSGPGRDRRRHDEGRRAHRRGQSRRQHHDHRQGLRSGGRPEEGRGRQHRPDRSLHRQRCRARGASVRLEVETHIVTAAATAVQNLAKCVIAAGVKIDELVAASLASAEAVLSDTEKELGVAVADIGAGTIDLALYADGSPFHTAVLPVGGNNVTNDVAIGLKTSLQVAEELKVRHGTADLRGIDPDEAISVAVLGEEAGRTVSRLEVCQIIEARMRETFDLLKAEMASSGHGVLPAGIILTGGAAQLAGVAELGREIFEMPVRIAAPSGVGGLVDNLLTPVYSASVGLLMWGAASVTAGEPSRYDSAPAMGGLGRIRDAIRSLFP